jgi:PAS domain S-box-containing protein
MASNPRDPARTLTTVVVSADGAPPGWTHSLESPAVFSAADPALLDALSDAGAVLIDASAEAPLSVARRVRRRAPEIQLVLVATGDRARDLQRAMLFTPGLGEPWLLTPEEADSAVVGRAAEITRKRRSHARTLDRLSGRVALLQRPDAQPRRLSNQYLGTLLEMLPEPVFALDEAGVVLFANPVARSAFGMGPGGSGERTVDDLLEPLDHSLLASMLTASHTGVVRGQLRLGHDDGSGRGGRIYHTVIAPVPSERPVRAMVLHDVTDQVRAQEAVAELAAQRTTVLDNIADGVILVDETGRISFTNEAAARIHGGEHVGLPPEDWPAAYGLLKPGGEPYPAGELPLARALLHGETVRDAEWLIRRPDGTVVHAQGSAAPVVEAGGRTVGAVLTVRDVSEQRRREAERERLLEERDRALDELHEAMRHRSRFYASMSHELRTPINAIIGYNQLLAERLYGDVGEDQAAALERIGRAARHLLDLVNDVLDLSKIEAGKLNIEAEPVQIGALTRDLEATMEPFARTHDVELRFLIDGSCDATFVTDPRRVRQVLLNLISNAIRYGAGSPVEVRCERDDGVRISVHDQGPGIDPDRVEDIFEEFVQLGGGENGGTGLGLAISRALARALGGDVTVVSRPDQGSTFTLALPPEPPDPNNQRG